jgi:hypothetical protein
MLEVESENYKIKNKMKNQRYHTVGTIPISNITIAERGQIDTPSTHTHTHTHTQTDRQTHTHRHSLELWIKYASKCAIILYNSGPRFPACLLLDC